MTLFFVFLFIIVMVGKQGFNLKIGSRVTCMSLKRDKEVLNGKCTTKGMIPRGPTPLPPHY